MNIIDVYNEAKTIVYEKLPTKTLREIAMINKETGGIFKKYNESEINILTKRQIITMFKTEKKYKELRRDYHESNQ